MNHDTLLREHLVELLGGGHAHLHFEKAVGGLPPELRGKKPPGLPHTPWRLMEHMRIAQWDILRFSVDPNHVSPEFPKGYWPEGCLRKNETHLLCPGSNGVGHATGIADFQLPSDDGRMQR